MPAPNNDTSVPTKFERVLPVARRIQGNGSTVCTMFVKPGRMSETKEGRFHVET